MHATLALQLLFGLIDRASEVKALIDLARSEGRDVTEAELDAIVGKDDAARDALVKAIVSAKADATARGE